MMKNISKSLISLSLVAMISIACNKPVPNSNLQVPEESNTIPSEEVSTFAAESASQILSEFNKDKAPLKKEQALLSETEMKDVDKNADGTITQDEIAVNIKKEFDSAAKISQTLDTNQPTQNTDSIEGETTKPFDGDIPPKPPTSTPSRSNKVQLYVDREEILPMMMETIKNAKKSIQMDLYLLGGNIGLEVAQELAKKKAEGVDIKLMFDPNMGFSGPTQQQVYAVIDFLKKNKIDFRLYPLHLMPKVADGLLKNKFQIDHDKITVVDESIFIIGGFNLFDIGVVNRDIMLKIEGPTAKDATDLLAYEWTLGDKYIAPKPPKNVYVVKADQGADAMVKIVKTAPFESSTKKALIDMIDNATTSVYLAVLEFSDQDVTNALVRAFKRGVDVRVLMDRKDTNDKYAGGLPVPTYFPNILPARELFKNHVPVRWYDARFKGQELHMKMCVADESHLIAGSTNFTRQAFTTFRETSVQVDSGTAPVKMSKSFMEDWLNHSTAIKKFTLKDKIKAKVVEFLDKKYYGWW